MEKRKMMKTANTLYKIINVLEKLLLVALVVVIIGFIVVLFFAKGSDTLFGAAAADQTLSLDFGNVVLDLSPNALPNHSLSVSTILLALAACFVGAGVLYYGLRLLKQILAQMKEGVPFDNSVSANIKKLSFLVLGGGLGLQLADAIGSIIMVREYGDIMPLFKDGMVTGITYNFNFDLGFVLVGLLIYLLSYVFEYGQELQRESDETL